MRDSQLLIEGIKIARRIAHTQPLESYWSTELAPGPACHDDIQLQHYVRQTVSGLFHPVGTCKMGPRSDDGAVVDSRLRVHGIHGLRVIDASIMPIITSGNTHAPTVMIGEKGASAILEENENDRLYSDSSFFGGITMNGLSATVRGELPKFFSVDPSEQMFVRFAEGVGEVRADGKGLSIKLNVYSLDGQPDGTEICVGEVKANNLHEFLNPPPNPNVQFGDPGPISEVPVTSICQAKWTFEDGSTITAVGKGTSHIVPLPSQGVIRNPGIMKDKAAMIITGGTGRFDGARGGVTIDSSVFLQDVMSPPVGQAVVVFSVVTPQT
jgi:hypothetical protein